MLLGLLKNEIAIQVSINIMDAFVEMKKFVLINGSKENKYICLKQIENYVKI